ncbi:MAG: phosphomannomutase/phosphoglucomutase [Patescibacteria group bacterium]|nr:phosphomannomutase/phosphoglucomutase [Patescibacteria group bacterium]
MQTVIEKIDSSIFKAYDIRGIYPKQINAELVYKITQAYAKLIHPKTVCVGTDMRLCGEEFKQAAIKGLTGAGVNVIDLGLISTDQMYFAVVHLKADGGIMATASHNPKEFGGLKLVREQSRPISGDSGIYEIRDLVISNFQFPISKMKGEVEQKDIRDDYYRHVLKPFNVSKLKPLKIVANANFGMANPAIENIKNLLPIKFVKILNGHLDGSFPKGPSDPLLPSNRPETIAVIKELKPDLGVAWDGDADRCFFFDENGEFVTPAYINALLAEYYLKKNPGAKILHDTRVVRVIDYVVKENGGISATNKAGHSFIKERMISDDIVFGCETSGHYYFKDNFYLDNGLFPFLAVLDILSLSGKPFSEILRPLREKFYISEEINFEYNNPNILEEIKDKYSDAQIDNIDGYDFNYPGWRFNVRLSNTQNLLRVNLEANSKELLQEKTAEVTGLINSVK